MTEINFTFLRNLHETLLQKQQRISEGNQTDFANEVRNYIAQAKTAGNNISSTRERDQIRANLRYWANYLYSIDKTFPDIELAPSAVKSRPFSGNLVIVLTIFVLALVGAGILLGSVLAPPPPPPATPTASSTITAETPFIIATETALESTMATMQASQSIGITGSPTPKASGFNIVLSSPANGDFITPNIEFKGTFENLKPEWAIHVLFIRGNKFFPVEENFPIPEQPANNDWVIQTTLLESSEELSKAQSYSLVLALSLDLSSRQLLSNSTKTGIDINSLPPTVIPFQDTSRVVYRNAYVAIRENRIVYSLHDGTSYDLYTSKLDGSDIRKITNTPDIDERSPNLSPDGKKIVYLKFLPPKNTYTISVMDSNGQNDHDVINGEASTLERPKWSPDSSFIAYALGDTSVNPSRWSIHAYRLLTNKDQIISGEPETLACRHFSWLPDKDIVVFNARIGDTARFIQGSIDTLENFSVFFDARQEVIQPDIEIFRNGYLFTYTVINRDFVHEIYAIIDSDRQVPFDNSPVRLTKENIGADSPIFESPDSVYYIGATNNIYVVKFTVEGNKIILLRGANTNDGEYYGDLVIKIGQGQKLSSFDTGYLDAFFPIK